MQNISKKQSYDYELIAMCYHEAGHVICALNNYMKVHAVNVMDANMEGNTDYYLIDTNLIEDIELKKLLLILEIQVLYSGMMSEKFYYKDICGSDNFPMHLRIGSSSDIKHASDIIKKFNLASSGRDRVLFKNRMKNGASQIILENWDAIKLISYALYKNKKLTFKELKYILINKVKNKEYWKKKLKAINGILSSKESYQEKTFKRMLIKDSKIII